MAKKRKEHEELKTLIAQQFEYSDKVKEYLERTNKKFLDEFAVLCQKTNGRVAYSQIEKILGKNPPIAGWIDQNDTKKQIVIFFRELGFPFKATENHLYFP